MTDTFVDRPAATSPPIATLSIIFSMGLLAIGNGLLFAYVPLKLAHSGFPPWVAGAVTTALPAGGFVGCLITGHLVRRVGPARVFTTLTALVILASLMLTLTLQPIVWTLSRACYGFAVTGLFIVSQSWLNDAVGNQWRGKVVAGFYMTYVVGLGIGGYLIGFIPLEGNFAPLASVSFSAIAILPVGLTRLAAPTTPEHVTVDVATTWRASPVGLVGLLAAGGLTMMIQGFGPIYAVAEGYSRGDIALLLFVMQLGMIGVQFPLGVLSDRIDRRIVLLMAAVLVVAMAALTLGVGTATFFVTGIVFAVWAGATESLYAVSTAHTIDRADPADYVAISSTLLMAWSLTGFLVPLVATILTERIGPEAFIYVAIVLALGYAIFVAIRMTTSKSVPDEDQEPYQPISAQAPLAPDLAPLPPEGDAEAGDPIELDHSIPRPVLITSESST